MTDRQSSNRFPCNPFSVVLFQQNKAVLGQCRYCIQRRALKRFTALSVADEQGIFEFVPCRYSRPSPFVATANLNLGMTCSFSFFVTCCPQTGDILNSSHLIFKKFLRHLVGTNHATKQLFVLNIGVRFASIHRRLKSGTGLGMATTYTTRMCASCDFSKSSSDPFKGIRAPKFW